MRILSSLDVWFIVVSMMEIEGEALDQIHLEREREREREREN